MKHHFIRIGYTKGSTLVESALSLGVLAVAVPLVFAAMGEAGRTGNDADMDNRSAAIIPICIDAVERARNGEPGWFGPCPAGAAFPPEGETWALAFADDGRLLGRLTKEPYERGVRHLEGSAVRYLANLTAASQPDITSTSQPLHLTIAIEHPAALPLSLRSRYTFHSLLR